MNDQSDNVLSSETKLADKISTSLQKDDRTSDHAIDVINEHGVITLSGQVHDYKTREAAEEIAKKHQGVISVVNSIKVVKRDDIL